MNEARRDPEEEIVLPLPGPRGSVTPVTAFRSTWIVSWLEALRPSPHWERYARALGQHHDAIVSALAGTWLPVAVARAHYEACGTLGLSSDEIAALVEGPGGRVRRAWYAPYIAVAQAAESPWEVLAKLDRMWARGAQGGAVTVSRVGHSRARVEYVGCELFAIEYFCESVRTVLEILIGHACKSVEVTVCPQPIGSEGHYLARWT